MKKVFLPTILVLVVLATISIVLLNTEKENYKNLTIEEFIKKRYKNNDYSYLIYERYCFVSVSNKLASTCYIDVVHQQDDGTYEIFNINMPNNPFEYRYIQLNETKYQNNIVVYKKDNEYIFTIWIASLITEDISIYDNYGKWIPLEDCTGKNYVKSFDVLPEDYELYLEDGNGTHLILTKETAESLFLD